MVDFKSKIYYAEEDEIIGAEVTVYSEEGDNIGSIQVTSKKDFDDLKAKLDGLDETYISIDNLESTLSKISVNAQTLDNYSSTDFALKEHEHLDKYAPTDHSSKDNVYGLSNQTMYGHAKIINNLTRSIYADGEALSAKQGYDLNNLIDTLRTAIGTWQTQKVGSYGTLKINPLLRMVIFIYYRESYTVSKNVTLHSGAIPQQYRFTGTQRTSPSDAYTILAVNNAGDIILKTSKSTSYTGDIRGTFVWLY
ncbi:hypothetical protein [Methanobrevibacter sp.]|uniref:hypothetical protein n=1 Tax=Methanobrevibacter sp. TaxID=66852 RepID=UPI00388F25B7